ncbi:hypothetical protein M422DRAFT_262621 [Sphaerobolus stellatus SS14]|uniref:Uncharacterized protein n=1 Tax=Sphaerobolus stellatus (strain SS14) TaxID=990650 RepID=A0A0C9VCX2_SPHS4|nr:hypothetical protein M422DRAFT_262621 [Sphaerobolus stellatus SS14]
MNNLADASPFHLQVQSTKFGKSLLPNLAGTSASPFHLQVQSAKSSKSLLPNLADASSRKSDKSYSRVSLYSLCLAGVSR